MATLMSVVAPQLTCRNSSEMCARACVCLSGGQGVLMACAYNITWSPSSDAAADGSSSSSSSSSSSVPLRSVASSRIGTDGHLVHPPPNPPLLAFRSHFACTQNDCLHNVQLGFTLLLASCLAFCSLLFSLFCSPRSCGCRCSPHRTPSLSLSCRPTPPLSLQLLLDSTGATVRARALAAPMPFV